jgi:2-beta-glucuronyltransferase
MSDKKNIFTLISRHYFSADGRKTTVHFIAREFAKRGYQVNFVTVGRSRLSLLGKAAGKGLPKDLSYKKFNEIEPNIFSIVMNEFIHPISASNGILKYLTAPKILNYGSNIPQIAKTQIVKSNIVLIECGYGVAYYDALRSLACNAKLIYFATDPLTQVGLRAEFEEIETRTLPLFDLVRVANGDLATRFPPNTNVIQIPQGLDKAIFDEAGKSPYQKGTTNIVSIGDMAFDQCAICTMANARPDVTIHIFGADISTPYPANIIIHGEVNFSTLVPYIKYADVGVMPYKMKADMGYLTKTSLKFLQYTYCGLPILTPEGPDWERAKIFSYNANESSSIAAALNAAIAAPKDLSMGGDIWDWTDCTDKLIREIN